jgi:hypothetical protein
MNCCLTIPARNTPVIVPHHKRLGVGHGRPLMAQTAEFPRVLRNRGLGSVRIGLTARGTLPKFLAGQKPRQLNKSKPDHARTRAARNLDSVHDLDVWRAL